MTFDVLNSAVQLGFFQVVNLPIASMGLVPLPTFTIKESTIHVGKYTNPKDPMGVIHHRLEKGLFPTHFAQV